MFQVIIEGSSPAEVRAQCLTLAHALGGNEPKQSVGEELGYKGADMPPTKVNRKSLPEIPAQPTVPHAYPVPDQPEEAQPSVLMPAPATSQPSFSSSISTPSPVPPTSPATSTSQETDSRGFRWDDRIHAGSKTKNQDGTWRYRRGIQDHEIANVEAELKGSPASNVVPLHQAPVIPPAPAPTVPVDMAPYQPQAESQPQPVQSSVVPPSSSASVAPAAAIPTTGAHTLQSFTDNLFVVMANLIAEKKISQDWVESVNKHFGVGNIWEIAKNPAQVKELFDTLISNKLIQAV